MSVYLDTIIRESKGVIIDQMTTETKPANVCCFIVNTVLFRINTYFQWNDEENC